MMSKLIIGIPISIALIIGASLIASPFIERESNSRPAIHFYGAAAYADCAGMRDQAKARGYSRWICRATEKEDYE